MTIEVEKTTNPEKKKLEKKQSFMIFLFPTANSDNWRTSHFSQTEDSSDGTSEWAKYSFGPFFCYHVEDVDPNVS